ncbi:hypothetical protein DDJ45_10325 [Mycobacteroides abscessus]|nr:hypothetical protein DDJ45_10325 [Mycobacteroides abscessus]
MQGTLNKAFALIGQRPFTPAWLCRNGMLDATTRLAQAMDRTPQDSVRTAVTEDVAEEINAVAQARAGDLTGRASQALLLSPRTTSAEQLHIAETILRNELLEASGPLELVEPTAAATVASVWLQAAAFVAASASGLTTREIFELADTIEPIPVEVPAKVVELLGAGTTPQTVVSDLIGDAVIAQSGRIPCLEELEQAIAEANRYAAPHRSTDPRVFAAIRQDVRVCLIDTRLPAPSLRTDLLAAIHGCWLVYRDHRGTRDTAGTGRSELLQARFTDCVRDRRAQLTFW